MQAGALYFVLVFATGFVLGVVRTLLVVPATGVRAAELLELPVMLLASFLAARWVVRRCAVPPTPTSRLLMGAVALTLMLTAEFGFVLRLRGLSFAEYLATRDPVSGTAYYLTLLLFAAMPLLLLYAPERK